MKIGELSRRTGVSVRMLRYYEAEHCLSPSRTDSGYRDFDQSDVHAVEQIILLGNAGMTLSTIRDFLPCSIDGRSAFEPCDELKVRLRQHIEHVDERRRALAASRKLLSDLLETFERSSSPTRIDREESDLASSQGGGGAP